MTLLLLFNGVAEAAAFNRYELGGEGIPRPESLTREFIHAYQDTLSIKGTIGRDVSGVKEKYTLQWSKLSKAEYDTIIGLVEQNTNLTFTVTESNLSIVDTQVFSAVKNASYSIPGSDYLVELTLELIEVS